MNGVPNFDSSKKKPSRSTNQKKVAASQTKRAAKSQASSGESPAQEPVRATYSKKVRLAELTVHELHEEVFGPPQQEVIALLAKDIAENGLKHGIEVDSQLRIICGRKRAKALELNGQTDAEVIVRTDLDGNPNACKRELIRDNYIRQQLSPLVRARCVQMLVDQHGEKTPGEMAELVASELGVCPKTIRRQLSVLSLPRVFQMLFDEGILKHRQIAKLVGMNEADLAKWAGKCSEATDPAKVLSELPGCKNRKSICRILSESDVWQQLERTSALIETHLEDTPTSLAPDQRALVKTCQAQLSKLLAVPKAKAK